MSTVLSLSCFERVTSSQHVGRAPKRVGVVVNKLLWTEELRKSISPGLGVSGPVLCVWLPDHLDEVAGLRKEGLQGPPPL